LDPATVYLITALPFHLAVDGDCLRTESATVVGGYPVDVLTPTLKSSKGDHSHLYGEAPPIPGLIDDVDWAEQLGVSHPWVLALSWRTAKDFGPGDSAALSHVVLRAAVNGKDESTAVAQAMQSADADWAHLVGDWLEVAASGWLHRPDRHGHGALRLGSRPAWIFDGRRAITPPAPPIVVPVHVGQSSGVSIDLWRTVLRLAGDQRVPPTEHVLLRDARGSLKRNELRRAILDAATAAEIAEAKILDGQTAPYGQAISDAIRDSNKDLGRLSATLRKTFNIPIPENFQEGLVSHRNRAIHAGVEPDQRAVMTAIDLAATVVEMATPLSSLLS